MDLLVIDRLGTLYLPQEERALSVDFREHSGGDEVPANIRALMLVETLLDDRNARPGVKFKDADLIGIPVQVVVGDRGLKEGVVEIKRRASGEKESVAPGDVVARVRAILDEMLASLAADEG